LIRRPNLNRVFVVLKNENVRTLLNINGLPELKSCVRYLKTKRNNERERQSMARVKREGEREGMRERGVDEDDANDAIR